jgi:hypothetical protein
MTPAAVPQIAFALPPSLDGFLNRLQLGAEQMLYPLVHPVAITSVFGWRTHPIYGGARFHTGIDLGTPIGSPVLAAFTGTVISADWMGGYGNVVLIRWIAIALRSLIASDGAPWSGGTAGHSHWIEWINRKFDRATFAFRDAAAHGWGMGCL